MENLLIGLLFVSLGANLTASFINVLLAGRVLREDPKLRTLETRTKALELEWENTFEKLKKVAGRADREKRTALEANADQNSKGGATLLSPAAPISRQELLARIRGSYR